MSSALMMASSFVEPLQTNLRGAGSVRTMNHSGGSVSVGDPCTGFPLITIAFLVLTGAGDLWLPIERLVIWDPSPMLYALRLDVLT